MKQIKEYISERLKISSDLNKKEYKYFPQSKKELKNIINKLLDERGLDANLNDIDVSKITDLSYLFANIKDIQNIDISEWDVSNVRDMGGMFFQCEEFNSDLSQWNISSCNYITEMFYGCKKFNCDLSNWNTNNLKEMTNAFKGCIALKKIPKWYNDNDAFYKNMFSGCKTVKTF